MDPPPLPTPTQQTHAAPAKPRAYIIRMDTHYDPDTHLLTAVLEVPGVKREHLSVRLSTCSYNRVRQITVTGAVHPPFGIISPLTNPALAASGAFELASNVSVRERKYGPCQRVIPVPSDLKVRTFSSSLLPALFRAPCGFTGMPLCIAAFPSFRFLRETCGILNDTLCVWPWLPPTA
jgi:hypothetical protein